MPHYSEYRCSVCGQETLKELLVVKAVVFKTMGSGPRLIRSRTKAWICDVCLPKDSDYNSESFASAPGMKSSAKERVEEALRLERR